jgi:hypothetical protein
MQDERATSAVKLFQDAWVLLSDLTDLKGRLPEPNMPSRGPLPADWNELRSYAVCVDMLRISLRLALRNVVTGLDARQEFQIRDAIMPSSVKFGRDAQAWLRSLDEP